MRRDAAALILVAQKAADWLGELGYRVLAHGFESRSGTIDLIALEGDVLCFVVLRQSEASAGRGRRARLGRARERRLCRAAVLFMARNHLERRPCRFDVMTVRAAGPREAFRLTRNAFPFAL